MREYASLIDANALPAAIFGKLKAQAALANPGFADDTDQATVALDRIRELKFEGGELIVSPDQRRQAPSAAEDVACRGIEQPRQLEHFYRSCDPANGLHAEPLIIGPSTAPAMVSGNEIPIAPLPAAGNLPMLTSAGEVRPLEDMENEIIRFAISHYRGQMSEVARRLKIGRSTLYRKLDEAAENETGDDAG